MSPDIDLQFIFILLVTRTQIDDAGIVSPERSRPVQRHVAKGAIVWEMLLLAILTYVVAHERKVKPLLEVVNHLLVASAVIIANTLIPLWIGALLS